MAQIIKDVLHSMGLEVGGDKRILVLGLYASGRATALNKLLNQDKIITKVATTTLACNVESVGLKHPTLGQTTLTAWDVLQLSTLLSAWRIDAWVGGCEKLRPIHRQYYPATHGLVWFVDSNDRDSIPLACEDLHSIAAEPQLKGIPILVLANMQDLPNSMSVEEVQRRMKMGLFKDREWNCMPAVATTGDGLWEAIHWLTTAMDTWLRSPECLNRKVRKEPQWEEPVLEQWPIVEQWLKIEDGPDDEFLKGVEDYTLDSWDHRTHLRLAWLYLKRHGRREGMRRIFASIKSFIENSPRTKRGSGRGTTFHATLTYTWAHLVDFAIASTKNPTETFKGFLIMNPQLSNGGLPLHYFTKKLLFDSAESRAEVVLPDKRPLPSIITNINHLEIKERNDPSKVLGPPKKTLDPLTDAQFLASVRDRMAQGWGHEAMLRVVWACLRLHGVRQGPDYASHVLRSFQGDGFHYTITRYWCQVLRKLMVHDWQPAVVRLDAAAVAREAAWKAKAAEQQVASQAALQDTQWATDLLKTLTEGQTEGAAGQPAGAAGAAEQPVGAATAAGLQVEQATGAGAAQVGQSVGQAVDEADALPPAERVAETGGEMYDAAAAATALQQSVALLGVVPQPAEYNSPASEAAQPAEAAAGLGSSSSSSGSIGSQTQHPDEQAAGPSALAPATASLPCPPALPFTTLPALARAPSSQASVPASSPAGRQQSEEADWVMLDTKGSNGTGTPQVPGAATTAASSVLDEVARMRVVDSVASMAGMHPGGSSGGGNADGGKQPHTSATQGAGHTTTAKPVGVKAAALHPGGLFLLESCAPAASAQIPTFPALLAGQGYASETARKLVLDQHMYLIHYSKKLIYSDEAARTLVVPDKQQLPSLA